MMQRSQDHETSKEAAKHIKPQLSALMAAVHSLIAASGRNGLTDSELHAAMLASGWSERPESTFRKRRSELAELGLVVWSGLKRAPKGAIPQKVWIATGINQQSGAKCDKSA